MSVLVAALARAVVSALVAAPGQAVVSVLAAAPGQAQVKALVKALVVLALGELGIRVQRSPAHV